MLKLLSCAALLLAAAPLAAAEIGGAEPFDFVAIGDMPYTLPDDVPRFERLIAAVNAQQPAFTIHVGDIKSGSSPCSDEAFARIKAHFDSFRQPLVYTPGDNEWTDCHREKAGKFDPLDRLAKLRAMFFGSTRSFGATPLELTRQSDVSEHKSFVENARWVEGNVLFATVHVVGSNNNLQRNREAALEYFDRNEANLAWIEEAFAAAQANGNAAIVLAMQADPSFALKERDGNGFNDTLKALSEGAAAFAKPVLLVHGDTHRLVIDQPLMAPDGQTALENFYRLQVMGAEHVHGVRVIVDPASPSVFSFQPLIVPENLIQANPTQ